MATIKLNEEIFKNQVFDFTQGSEWNFKGEKPAIIDFYADWCGPCQMVAPVFEELSEEYKNQVTIYKVDTEAEQRLAAMFQIRSIPSILFIPANGEPKMLKGALPKHDLKNVIEQELLNV